MSGQLVSLKLAKQRFHFSAAHFTIFSATERERLHGHNYFVEAEVFYRYPDGFIDYNQLKDRIEAVCQQFDEYTLLPLASPHLQVTVEANRCRVRFNQDEFLMPLDDVRLLPVDNITIEALAVYIGSLLKAEVRGYERLVVTLSSGPGQAASCEVTA